MAKVEVVRTTKEALYAFKRNWLIWTIFAVIFALIGLISNPQFEQLDPRSLSVEQLKNALNSALISTALLFLLSPFVDAFSFESVMSKDTADTKFIRKTAKPYFKMLIFTFIFTVIMVLGLFALIIPGIYLAARYGMGVYLIYKNPKMGVSEAFTKSAELTEGEVINIFLSWFFVVLFFSVLATSFATIVVSFNDIKLIDYFVAVITNILSTILPMLAAASIFNQLTKK